MPRGGKREGAGRKVGTGKGEGLASHVVRVSSEVTKDQCNSIPSLIATLDHWEEECRAAGEGSARHYFLRQMIDEIRALGY
jgi:hypothetical protein